MKLWLCYRMDKINEEEKKDYSLGLFRDKPLSLHDLWPVLYTYYNHN